MSKKSTKTIYGSVRGLALMAVAENRFEEVFEFKNTKERKLASAMFVRGFADGAKFATRNK